MKHKTIKHIKTLDGWTDQTEIDVKISAQYTALTAYTEKKARIALFYQNCTNLNVENAVSIFHLKR